MISSWTQIIQNQLLDGRGRYIIVIPLREHPLRQIVNVCVLSLKHMYIYQEFAPLIHKVILSRKCPASRVKSSRGIKLVKLCYYKPTTLHILLDYHMSQRIIHNLKVVSWKRCFIRTIALIIYEEDKPEVPPSNNLY